MVKQMSVSSSLCKMFLPTNAVEADSNDNRTASSNRRAKVATIDGQALGEVGTIPLGPAVLAALY